MHVYLACCTCLKGRKTSPNLFCGTQSLLYTTSYCIQPAALLSSLAHLPISQPHIRSNTAAQHGTRRYKKPNLVSGCSKNPFVSSSAIQRQSFIVEQLRRPSITELLLFHHRRRPAHRKKKKKNYTDPTTSSRLGGSSASRNTLIRRAILTKRITACMSYCHMQQIVNLPAPRWAFLNTCYGSCHSLIYMTSRTYPNHIRDIHIATYSITQ